MKIVDEDYLNHIREEPCIACCKTPVDPDHIQTRKWREPTRNDHFVLPLCRACHTEREQIGNERFNEKWQIDLWHEVAVYMSEYYARLLPQRPGLRLVKGKLD